MAHIVSGNVVSPGIGLVNCDGIMTLATGLTCAAGDLLAVDMTKVRDAANGALVFYEMRAPVTADFLTATTAANVQPYMGVALEAQATAAGNVRVRFMGEVDALITATSLAIGQKLTPTNASRSMATQVTGAGSGVRCVAVLKEATTATGQIKRVDFDGLNGVIANGNMITNAS